MDDSDNKYGYGYDWGYGSEGSPGSAGEEPTIDPRPGDGTPGPGWGNAGNWGTFLTDLDKSGIGGALKGLFGGKYGDLASMLAFMGLSGVANQSNFFNPPPTRVGYQGTIPQYTASRTQTPMEQQRPVSYESITPREGEAAPAVMRPVPYRPGQGGITYFTPMQYTKKAATGGQMEGGIAMLAKGRYLKGNGDGVSDSIPAKFDGSGQPARLADGEFVIPARVVSEIGNGSSDAGARKLYAMLDRVERRAKASKRGKPSGADKELNKLA